MKKILTLGAGWLLMPSKNKRLTNMKYLFISPLMLLIYL